MLVVGLTGSIGMGKSTAARRLRFHGLQVFDADKAVHLLYEGAAVPLIEAAFPGSTREGRVDRQALSSLLNGQPERFKRLEAIVHPLVQNEERMFLQTQNNARADIAVLEVPLLFETGLDAKVDTIIVVSAPFDVQRERVLARPGMTVEKFDSIVTLQMPDAEKCARADFIVDTAGTFEASEQQIDDIVVKLGAITGTAFDLHWS